MKRGEAYWTYSSDGGVHCYYFAPSTRVKPPYHEQREVTAIIDIAADGTLAGVELVFDMPPPPSPVEETERSTMIVGGSGKDAA